MRQPRPLGTTELGIQYNRTYDNDHYISMKQLIINHYIRNNFSYCGQYMNIEQFAYMIKESPITIQKQMGNYGKELVKLNDELFSGDICRALANFSINNCLEDRSLAHQQLSLLLHSQGSSYAPFISGEVNKAIKLMMDANTNLQSLIRTLGGNTASPLGAQENPNRNSDGNGITTDEAVRLIKDMAITPLLQDDKARDNLYREYGIGDTPEVNALLQVGMDTSKEGLAMNDITKLNMDQVITHENRREEEFDLDPNSDEI